METISISKMLEDNRFDLRLKLIAGKDGLGKRISSSRVQKPGLALTGFTEHLHPERVQVFGTTEMSYLRTMQEEQQRQALTKLFDSQLACVVVTKGQDLPQSLIDGCEKTKLALMRSSLSSSMFISHVQAFLEDALTATGTVHGVLVDVFGVGVLLRGKSGAGKSEIALDLIMRGHRLVADDVVYVARREEGTLFGHGNEMFQHHMEIRGLGIINIKDLFGVAAVRTRKKIELVMDLVEWDPKYEYDRLGLDETTATIVGVDLPKATVPIRPGRNMTTIIEVAARNHLLKLQGHHASREFADKLRARLSLGREPVDDEPSGILPTHEEDVE